MAQDLQQVLQPSFLDIVINPRGKASLELRYANEVDQSLLETRITEALARVLPCQMSVASYYSGFLGTCDPKAIDTGVVNGWRSNWIIRLDPLLTELNQAGSDELHLTITHPYAGFSKLTPDLTSRPPSRLQLEIDASTRISTQAPELTEITLELGFSVTQGLFRFGLMLGILGLSGAAGLRIRTLALRHYRDGDPGAWFKFCKSLMWLDWLVYASWAILWFGLKIPDIIYATLPATWPTVATSLTNMAWFSLPPILALATVRALTHPVIKLVGQQDWTASDLIQQAFWEQVVPILPILIMFTGFRLLLMGAPTQGLGLMVVGIAIQRLGPSLLARSLDWEPYALTSGELRDSIFKLADQAKVDLKQIYVLPTGKGKLANAFAAKNGMVFISELLLNHLNKREVDSIAAHEIAHLRPGSEQLPLHLRVTRFLRGWGFVIGIALLSSFTSLPLTLVFALGLGLSVLAILLESQYQEQQADIQGSLLTQDPEAMITGLAKIHQLNQVSLTSERWDDVWSTHPTFAKRAQAIAEYHQLSSNRFKELLQPHAVDLHHVDDPYLLPLTEKPLFNSIFKGHVYTRHQLKLLIIQFFLLLITALGAQPMAIPSSLLLYSLGWLVTMGTSLILQQKPETYWQPLQLEHRRKLEQQGITVKEGFWVGLAPSEKLSLYEGFYIWDVGFLLIQKGQVIYLGEQTQFRLSPEQITAIELDRGSRLGIPARLQLHWKAADPQVTTKQAAYILPLGHSSTQSELNCLTYMEERLRVVQSDPDVDSTFQDLDLGPQFGSITSAPVKPSLDLRWVLNLTLVFNLPVVVIASVLLPLELRTTFFVILSLVTIQMGLLMYYSVWIPSQIIARESNQAGTHR